MLRHCSIHEAVLPAINDLLEIPYLLTFTCEVFSMGGLCPGLSFGCCGLLCPGLCSTVAVAVGRCKVGRDLCSPSDVGLAARSSRSGAQFVVKCSTVHGGADSFGNHSSEPAGIVVVVVGGGGSTGG